MSAIDDLIYAPICPNYEVLSDRVTCRVQLLPGKTCNGFFTMNQMKNMAERQVPGGCSTRPDDCPVIAYYRQHFHP